MVYNNSDLHTKIFLEEFKSNLILQKYIKKEKLIFEKLLGEGRSSWIILFKQKQVGKKENNSSQVYAQKNKQEKTQKKELDNPFLLLTIKLEKKRSTRTRMVENESKFLKLLNKKNIGPKFVYSNKKGNFVIYEYFDATSLIDYLDKFNKQDLVIFLNDLFKQAKTMDEIGIDHGQLAGRGTNILVLKNNLPIIVDFEKSSNTRKTHNINVLKSYFFNEKSLVYLKLEKIFGKNLEKIKKEIELKFSSV